MTSTSLLQTILKPTFERDDDEFDLPNAEEYFASVNIKKPDVIPPRFLEEEEDQYEGTAAQSCFALPEILERIVQYVPPLEVYRLQRVNTMFRDLISRSIPIRRHMYFVPEKYFVRRELNQLLGLKSQEKSRLAQAVYPFHFELFAERAGPGIKIFPAMRWAHDRKATLAEHLFPENDALSNAQASWRTILILDSGAPLRIEFFVRHPGNVKWVDRHSEFKQAAPMTLGDIVDLAKRLTKQAWRDRHRLRLEMLEQDLMFEMHYTTYYDDDDEDDDDESEA